MREPVKLDHLLRFSEVIEAGDAAAGMSWSGSFCRKRRERRSTVCSRCACRRV